MEDQYFGNGVTDEFDEEFDREFELEEYQPDAFYRSLKAALQLLAREQQVASSVAA